MYRISNQQVLCVAVGSANRCFCLPCCLLGIGVLVGVAMLLQATTRPLVIGVGGVALFAITAAALRDCRTLYVDGYGLLVVERCLWRRTRQTRWWRDEVAAVRVGAHPDAAATPGHATCDLILRHTGGREWIILDSDLRQPLQDLCEEIRSRLALPAQS